MSDKVFTLEELNYFRICYITSDIIRDGLQSVFKEEWDRIHGYRLQSRPKVVGTLELDHVSPTPLINVGKYRVFSNKKGKNHPIIKIVSGGRGELASCPKSFVWDCRRA